jgi:hypothetical protein
VQSIVSTLLPPSEFDTAELAIKRRAEKNVIGTLPFDAAAILARRGLVMNDKNKVLFVQCNPFRLLNSRSDSHQDIVEIRH